MSELPTQGRPRPSLFRALGRGEPPARIEIDGASYELDEVLKHDSWAASAVYAGEAGRVVVKWNRQEPLLGLNAEWIGHRLARRERAMLAALQHLRNVPRLCGEVCVDGEPQPHAIAHVFVEGHPLGTGERVDDAFFPDLLRVIQTIHERGWAYVDLHKRENLLVGDDGLVYLLDFQICLLPPDNLFGRSWPVQSWLRRMQESDLYHVYKHWCRSRPDLLPEDRRTEDCYRPPFNRLVRRIGNPMRATRRRLLVLLGIRKGRGYSHTEAAPEDAVKRDLAQGIRPE